MNKCVRRSLAWNAKVDIDQQQCGGQYLELPRAISDPNGNPHKGTKSNGSISDTVTSRPPHYQMGGLQKSWGN